MADVDGENLMSYLYSGRFDRGILCLPESRF